MTTRLQKQAVLSYVPAVPAVPARPAYCIQREVFVGYKDLPPESAKPTEYVFVPNELALVMYPNGFPVGTQIAYQGRTRVGYLVPPMQYAQTTPPRVPVYQTVTDCYPAVEGSPGSPARVDKSAVNGWNGGARSIARVPVDHYVQVDVPASPAGIIIGLANGEFEYSYPHAQQAVVVRHDGVTPIESGENAGPEAAPGTTITLIRKEDCTTALVDGAVAHEFATPFMGTAYANVVLYGINDYVENPVIGAYRQPSAPVVAGLELQAEVVAFPAGTAVFKMTAHGSTALDGLLKASGESVFFMQASGDATVKHGANLLAVMSISTGSAAYASLSPDLRAKHGDMSYAAGAMSMAGLAGSQGMRASGRFSRATLSASIGRVELETFGALGVFPPPMFSGTLKAGGIMSVSGAQGATGKASADSYFGGASSPATSYVGRGWWKYLPDDMLDGDAMLLTVMQLGMESMLIFALHDGVNIRDSLDLYALISLSSYESVAVGDNLSLLAALEVAIRERMAVTEGISASQREAIQYAVNAATGALSRYENFGFKQFATTPDGTYAITGSGLYALRGGDDDGDTINAAIDFGASDYGTAQAKRVSSVYAGISTDGSVYLRVSADEEGERVYRVVGGDNEGRSMTAKGIAARHWRVRLELVDASYADLDNVEIEIGASQRRIRR